MKKIVTLLLAVAVFTFGFAGCGGSKDSAGEQSAAPEGTPEEIIEAVYAEKSVGLNLMTMPVDLEDSEAVKYNLGIDELQYLNR